MVNTYPKLEIKTKHFCTTYVPSKFMQESGDNLGLYLDYTEISPPMAYVPHVDSSAAGFNLG